MKRKSRTAVGNTPVGVGKDRDAAQTERLGAGNDTRAVDMQDARAVRLADARNGRAKLARQICHNCTELTCGLFVAEGPGWLGRQGGRSEQKVVVTAQSLAGWSMVASLVAT